ncbi:MAG TPA: DUF1761 domain-containing protein [Caulobacteraceae bacterium]|nr:DUF1761 domain-containing protein [Caulobacteraceae bacterium]
MPTIAINPWAVAACVLVRFLIGGLWYSPLLFLRAWQAETGVDDAAMKPRMPGALGSDLLGAILMSIVLALGVDFTRTDGAAGGAVVGVAAWVGFVAVTSIGRVTYEGGRWRLFLINGAYNLVTLVIMGAILGQWG